MRSGLVRVPLQRPLVLPGLAAERVKKPTWSRFRSSRGVGMNTAAGARMPRRPAARDRRSASDGIGAGPFVDERAVVEIDGRELGTLVPVVLAVLPFRLVAALGHQVHAAHHVAGVEI